MLDYILSEFILNEFILNEFDLKKTQHIYVRIVFFFSFHYFF
jgi:hypothetical protein